MHDHPNVSSDKCLRRSPRFTPNTALGRSALCDSSTEQPLKKSSKKPSSKKTKACLAKIESDFRSCDSDESGTNSGLIEFPEILRDEENLEEIKTDCGRGDSDGMVEKCLRSRKVPIRVIGSEIENTESNLLDRRSSKKVKTRASSEKKEKSICFFVGEPVPEEEARERWQWRYDLKSQRSKRQSWKLNAGEEDEIILNVECHHTQAKVGSSIYNLGDCACIKGNRRQNYVGRILEFFSTTDGENYIRVQWFFRSEDTVMDKEAAFHDKRRLFYSNLMNDNLLDCIISKVSVIQIVPTCSYFDYLQLGLLQNSIPASDFFYDMEYCVEYSTFRTLLTADGSEESYDLHTPDDTEAFWAISTAIPLEDIHTCKPYKELALLDLYSGCGGMSTGLCLGAKLASVNLVTRWAVDADRSACDSLKLNHPETQVRHETAEDFLELLKEWEKLCQRYVFNNEGRTLKSKAEDTRDVKSNLDSPSDVKIPAGEYEVLHLVDICYGDPSETGKCGLKLKVQWKGYGPDEDTWELIEELSNCQEGIEDFVRRGFKSKILPLPGDVDVLCGGPPCQGISGYNRFRNVDAPLEDERNRQIVVFMDIVKFLRPKYVLMENVLDILKFDKASLARYALSRLVHMKYQARLGTMAAGCYGLPQFRLRVFLWGALPTEKLPQFPLPTHDVIVRYWPPTEFERNTVAYDEGEPRELEEPIILRDAISDLPAVPNHETREHMTYEMPPESEFQKYLRLTKEDAKQAILYDHRPYRLSEDDYIRVCRIPHKKGANFRDLPGVIVGVDNVARRDPTKEQMMLPSGQPMVPNFAFNFEDGKSKRPYARLWWDETVATVITFPYIKSQAVLHPEQDRVLTIRESARLQGFPDFYRFSGTTKDRYRQIGNAVAVPVARALGYTLGMAIRKQTGSDPLRTLPPKFTFQQCPSDDETHPTQM
ncbi:DNA (cytosine-5)-methyltransferase CMT2-like isoform X3 [Actinidia eriantha]|uniref:DNA (cytosine-5)-methyltransferase CMT2-like isoform X3 n=1 Tax=Actinidia eriantha TaxID=165200 RepID=UPI002583CE53|nr:DNA (cytosine-5)-methyltransferase CMT2-like isoform X3 [Actinidia eriantha]